ncbi:hypothetical protein [Pseudomonas sp.]|uniref:hypothetical protein n=1 Tax=Pseudomonas sp. TaxID=306 RepID=UPI003FD798C8
MGVSSAFDICRVRAEFAQALQQIPQIGHRIDIQANVIVLCSTSQDQAYGSNAVTYGHAQVIRSKADVFQLFGGQAVEAFEVNQQVI